MLVLFTDTDTDITPKDAEEYGYKLISMPYAIDGVTIYPYEDFETFDYHTFYDKLRGGILPTTSAISEEKYYEYFEPYFKNGDDILYVHFSAAMTATFENMNIAVDKLKEKYKDTKFYAIDTKAITLGSLSIVKAIGDLYKNGATAEEIVEWSKTEVDKFAVYFFADDLKFFKRSGRVSGIAATMGQMIGIRPIIYMNSDGKMESIGKERGRENALNALVSYVEKLGDNLKDYRVLVGHSDNIELAENLADKLKVKFGDDLKIEFYVVNPTAGSHCGPDTIGVSFHAIHR